ncbi:MAG: 50S ribosomal protein L28 [Flavobacteriales bacterium]|jgi:large subunit ribosomal protein L28|nr:50S ribosomal protein L28 [Flavobacteriales bacterium]MDP4953446.1 50S ribosomal protein L28 [Flavobacteriales bacterium]
MARVCQLTGTRMMVGNNVSHSNRKTKRRFYPNLVKKRFFLESQGEYVTLKITASALRTVNKLGIEETIKRSKAKGLYTGA